MVPFVVPGKINMIIDGQFGSTGKGLIASYIASQETIDLAIGRLSPNAGHTFYHSRRKYVTKLLPVAGIIQPQSVIYLCAGSVIDVDLLLREMKEFDIQESRLLIHPHAAIISDSDRETELNVRSSVAKIASTQSGTGVARASKILRANALACGEPRLKKYLCQINVPMMVEDCKLRALVETGQGWLLSLQHSDYYPYVTSCDINPSAVLADVGAHPSLLGSVTTTFRTYPIRVGNLKDSKGHEVGYSGPVHMESHELTWDDLGVAAERTTVTKRIRRVFTFSPSEYTQALYTLKPDHVFLNFVNYLDAKKGHVLDPIFKMYPPTHVGTGPKVEDVYTWSEWIQAHPDLLVKEEMPL